MQIFSIYIFYVTATSDSFALLTLLKQLSILITDCWLSCPNTKPFGTFASFESMSNSNDAKKLSIFLFPAFICCSHRRNISVHLQLRVILLCLFVNRPNAYLANRYRSTFWYVHEFARRWKWNQCSLHPIWNESARLLQLKTRSKMYASLSLKAHLHIAHTWFVWFIVDDADRAAHNMHWHNI